jgi:hypothetical protein
MSSQTKSPQIPIQQDFPVTTSTELKLDRIANELASLAGKTEQRYDQEHDIFTK